MLKYALYSELLWALPPLLVLDFFDLYRCVFGSGSRRNDDMVTPFSASSLCTGTKVAFFISSRTVVRSNDAFFRSSVVMNAGTSF